MEKQETPKATINQTTADAVSSGIISTMLSALNTPDVQKLLALVCGFTLSKVLPKHSIDSKAFSRASTGFSSGVACATIALTCGLLPDSAKAPTMLVMVIAGATFGCANLVWDFLPREEDTQTETKEHLRIEALEDQNQELILLLNQANNEILAEKEEKRDLQQLITDIQEEALNRQNDDELELEHRPITTHESSQVEILQTKLRSQDQEISEIKEYYEDLLVLDEKHITALRQGSQDDKVHFTTQISNLKTEIQGYRDREERHNEEMKSSSDLIDSKEKTLQKLISQVKGAESLKKQKDHWKREAEILGKQIEDIYWFTEEGEGAVELYYRCKEAKVALRAADDEIGSLRSQRDAARERVVQLEKKLHDLKDVCCSQHELKLDMFAALVEKAAEIERLEEDIVSLKEEVEGQQRARGELETVGRGREEIRISGSMTEVEVEVEMEAHMDDELYDLCLF
ncbi:uncharacterized protein MYCFIDRAFT_197951 [Pseudocercospora fijiensis CIRAD86]|uniref:Uncharacterized protein n=1 Tax=Pseudocercospora fijiensis (strain CIRAD86) TaxID=383855 RepID=M3A948_PSEFD|nr:uncharacterized protein MYCFIDRAFT_197951 [Pseudocercospora fijiensis CIRAD86]EME81151.1 hypothetical protein MYCFIDRAFT_197951 [Pseudocercospora fijiensis CIRAD86]